MKNEDILEMNNGKKFSICLMNPPYVQDLHIRFLKKAIDISDKIISIQPIDFMYDIGHYCGWNKRGDLEYVLKHSSNIEKIKNAKSLFNINRCDNIGIFICDNNEHNTYLGNNVFNRDLIDVAEKFYKGKHLLNKCVRNENAGKYFVKLFKMHFRDDYEHYIDDIIVPPGNNNTSYGINFDSEEELDNFKKSLETWPYKMMYLLKDNQIAHLPWLGDYTHTWTDEELYEKFEITKEQQITIEQFIKNKGK